MLKLNASFSKKVPGSQQYSSEGFMASVEVELPDGLTQKQLEARISDTFELVRDSVEKELTKITGEIESVMPMIQTPTVTQQPANSKEVLEFASPKQIKYLTDIARAANVDLNAYFPQFGITQVAQLRRIQCSQLIDLIKGQKAA